MGTRIRIPIHVPLLLLPLGLSLFTAPVAAPAQTIAFRDTVYHLSEIDVRGERLTGVEELRRRPAFITLLPLEETSRHAASTAEYLGQTVGFHVKSAGGYGAFATASVRGSSAKQVSVLLDGVPIAQSSSGVVNLADLPLASLARVEVYRGASVYDLPGSNMGGVVNLVTDSPSDRTRTEMSASYGSLSTQRYSARVSLSRRKWNALVTGRTLSTEGDFDFVDDNSTPFNTEDDETAERINNHLEERELFLKINRQADRGTISLTNEFYHRRQGLPGYGANQSATEALLKTYDLVHLAWDRPAGYRFPLRTSAGLSFLGQKETFQDRREKKPGVKPDVENRSRSWGADLRWRLPLGRWHQSLGGMLEIREDTFRSSETLTETISHGRQTRRSIVATLEDEIRLWRGRLRLNPGVRYERYTDRLKGIAPRTYLYLYMPALADTTVTEEHGLGSVGFVADLAGGLSLKGNYARCYRAPSLMERFGYRGMVEPSPQLKPERGVNRDLGIRWESRPGSGRWSAIEVAYFWSDMEDLILYLYPSRRAAKAFNIDRAEIEGYEIDLAASVGLGFSLSGNLTRLSAVNRGDISYERGRYLPDRPELSVFSRLQWERGRWQLFYEWDYVGGNYWNSYNSVGPDNEGPTRTRRWHNAGFTVPTVLEGLDLSFEAKNITDDRVEDVMGYPMPGRTLYATLVFKR